MSHRMAEDSSKLLHSRRSMRHLFALLLILSSLVVYTSSQRRLWYPKVWLEEPQDYSGKQQMATLSSPRAKSLLVGLKGAQIGRNSFYNATSSSQKRALAYMMSPMSDQILQINRQWKGDDREFDANLIDDLIDRYKSSKLSGSQSRDWSSNCRTLRTSIELTKDETDKSSGRLIRTCKGLVQLNRCEGTCRSSLEPSIKSLSGFRKVSST